MEHNAAPAARAKQTAIEVEIVRAVVARKESALARAELALSHTHVVAPISGTVWRPHVAPGAFVDARPTRSWLRSLSSIHSGRLRRAICRSGTLFQTSRDALGAGIVQEGYVSLGLEPGRGGSDEHPGVPEVECGEIDHTPDMLTAWAGLSNPDNECVPGLNFGLRPTLFD